MFIFQHPDYQYLITNIPKDFLNWNLSRLSLYKLSLKQLKSRRSLTPAKVQVLIDHHKTFHSDFISSRAS